MFLLAVPVLSETQWLQFDFFHLAHIGCLACVLSTLRALTPISKYQTIPSQKRRLAIKSFSAATFPAGPTLIDIH
jgi:hypothetical protein